MTQITFDDLLSGDNLLSKDNLSNPAVLKDLPFDDIYEISKKEASRKKPIFFIHKYFARRTTCNFRLALLSLLSNNPKETWESFYSPSEIESNSLTILDPFMGGGTTIFEALRFNQKVIGNDLQPLSRFVTEAEIRPFDSQKIKKGLKILEKNVGEKIKSYYKTSCPDCNEEADVMYNFLVKQATVNEKTYDLYSSFILASKKGIYTLCCPECNSIFKNDFQNGDATCPECNYAISSPKESFISRGKYDREGHESFILKDLDPSTGYPFKTKPIAQEYHCPHCKSHSYKKLSNEDILLHKKASDDYQELKNTLPLPSQLIPIGYNTNQILNHNYREFKDLFSEKQLLCLGLLLKEINSLDDEELQFWLTLAFSASLEMNNMFCRYQHNAYKISNIFFNHAYVPITMPVENNVWGAKLGTGTFIKAVNKVIKGKEFNTNIYDIHVKNSNSEKVYSKDTVQAVPTNIYENLTFNTPLLTSGDSRNLDFIPDNSVDIILTDPPYGNNLMYSELIDFFHSWIYQSSIGKKIGFTTPLSPKLEEVIVNSVQNKTFNDYENGLANIFTECNRVLKDNHYLMFTFHDNNISGWSSIIKSTLSANFKLMAAYPIHAESRTGAHTSDKNSTVFDIFLIFKKTTDTSILEIDLEEIENKAFVKTNSFIDRLKKINAEFTIKDIENIFIGQFFVEAFKDDTFNLNSFDKYEDELKQILKSLSDIYSDSGLVEKRSGWWSNTHGKAFLNSLLEK